MPRIPRIDKGGVPGSAVPGGRIPSESGIEGAVDALQSGLQTGAKILAAEQKKRDEAEAKIQGISDTVKAGSLAEALNVEFRTIGEELKAAQADNPDQAVNDFQVHATAALDRVLKSAPNTAVAQRVATAGNSLKEAELNRMLTWKHDRVVQAARVGVDESLNTAMNAAGSVQSPLALEQYIGETTARLRERMELVMSPAEIEARTKDFKAGAVEAYSNTRMRADPLGFLAEVKSGAFDEYIDPGVKETMRKKGLAAYEGLKDARRMDLLVNNIAKNQEVHRAIMDGSFDADTATKMRVALRAQMGAVLTDARLAPEARKDEVQLLKRQIEVLDAAEDSFFRQVDATSEDDILAVEAIRQRIDDIATIRGRGDRREVILAEDKTLEDVVRVQRDLMLLRGEKKITKPRFDTLFSDLAQVVQAAGEAEAADSKTRSGLLWRNVTRTARQSGTDELNNRFKGSMVSATPAQQLAARMLFLDFLHDAQGAGTQVSDSAARAMAIRALAVSTGRAIPGVR